MQFYIPHVFHSVGELFIFYFVLERAINFKAIEILKPWISISESFHTCNEYIAMVGNYFVRSKRAGKTFTGQPSMAL